MTDDITLLFTEGYWICTCGRRFAQGQAKTPNKCDVCGSQLIKWIPGR